MARRLFLQRRSYRQNRLQDAARLLPILGIVLIFAPIFIRDADTINTGAAGTGTETWLVYYFAVWILLIVLTALVSWALVRVSPRDEKTIEGSDRDPGQGEGGA